jgi:hypothetical protein
MSRRFRGASATTTWSSTDARFGERIFTDRHLWSPRSDALVIEEWFFDPGYPWPKTARLVLINGADPFAEAELVRLYRGEDPASLREGFPTLQPLAWKEATVRYETLELDRAGNEVVHVGHIVRLPEGWR